MEPTAEILNFTDNLVAAVQSATGQRLDLTPETLPFLDYYGQIYRGSRDKKFTKDRAAAENLSLLLAPMGGAYFGQVIHAKYACQWHAPLQSYGEWRIQFEHCFLYFNPVAVAMEVFNQKEMKGWPAAFETRPEDEAWLCSILDELGRVSVEDYYTFSVRWEILDTVVARLETAEIMERGPGSCESLKLYNDADYESFIRRLTAGRR